MSKDNLTYGIELAYCIIEFLQTREDEPTEVSFGKQVIRDYLTSTGYLILK